MRKREREREWESKRGQERVKQSERDKDRVWKKVREKEREREREQSSETSRSPQTAHFSSQVLSAQVWRSRTSNVENNDGQRASKFQPGHLQRFVKFLGGCRNERNVGIQPSVSSNKLFVGNQPTLCILRLFCSKQKKTRNLVTTKLVVTQLFERPHKRNSSFLLRSNYEEKLWKRKKGPHQAGK